MTERQGPTTTKKKGGNQPEGLTEGGGNFTEKMYLTPKPSTGSAYLQGGSSSHDRAQATQANTRSSKHERRTLSPQLVSPG